jgi:hypothetical protein
MSKLTSTAYEHARSGEINTTTKPEKNKRTESLDKPYVGSDKISKRGRAARRRGKKLKTRKDERMNYKTPTPSFSVYKAYACI